MSIPPKGPAGRIRVAGAVAVIAALALALYRPWVGRPFDTLDFSEFLPLLTGPSSFGSRLAALTSYYVGEHGRLNVLSYAALAAKWTWLGASPVRWQWGRFAEMGLLTGGVYLLGRRLALRPLPALAAASLFVFSRLVSEAWTRMTMGEPMGLLCAVGALLVATTWRTTARPVVAAALAGVLLACGVLAKETLIGLLPLVWLVGTARGDDGRLGRPVRRPETVRQLFWSGFLPLAAFGAASVTALTTRSAGFTGLYGTATTGPGAFLLLAARPWLIAGARPGLGALLLPGNALFLLVMIAGLWLVARRAESRAHLRWMGLGAVACSAAYAVLYLPWPFAYLYYGIPFHLGPALLFGLAVQGLSDGVEGGPLLATVAWCLTVGATAPAAAEAASMTIAMQQVNGELVRTIAMVPNADRLVVARVSAPQQAWLGSAATLRRYAMATGAPATFPTGTQDLGCEESTALVQHRLGRTVFVTYLGNCGGLAGPSAHIARRYHALQVDWSGARWVSESVAADILVDRQAMTPRSP